MNNSIFESIEKDINENDIVLYMKGDANSPKCGFSSLVVSILKKLNLDFKAIDVLADENIRQAIKEYTDWPTIPQLYIKGEFIGGCDIVKEMYESKELEQLLKNLNLI